jgi:hypothetical protein
MVNRARQTRPRTANPRGRKIADVAKLDMTCDYFIDSMKFEYCAYIRGEVWEEFKRSLAGRSDAQKH